MFRGSDLKRDSTAAQDIGVIILAFEGYGPAHRTTSGTARLVGCVTSNFIGDARHKCRHKVHSVARPFNAKRHQQIRVLERSL